MLELENEDLMSRDEKKQYQLEQINDFVHNNGGMIKTAEIEAMGIDYRRVLALVEEGYLIRIKSGYYTTKYYKGSEEQWILSMFPDGVLTLESALYIHGYLKEKPSTWKLAVSKNISKSRFNIDYPLITPLYTEAEVLPIGVTEVDFAGGKMKVYSKERTICDCLKYQEKMLREDFKKGVLGYILDEDKDIAELMNIARERKVLKKVQNIIGIWL